MRCLESGRAKKRPEPLPDRDPATFTIVSRLETQKRLDHAVQAFARVVAEPSQAMLLIYGALKSAVERIDAKLGVEDNIKLCGWDPDARDSGRQPAS